MLNLFLGTSLDLLMSLVVAGINFIVFKFHRSHFHSEEQVTELIKYRVRCRRK